jgi:glycosyltransferase involved in cell wall biosynthesis
VDALPEPQRVAVWDLLADRASDVDVFISVSNYYKYFMCEHLKVSADRIHVVYNGVDLEGHENTDLPTDPPVIGYLERQCREKGFAMLVEAFMLLKKSGKVPGVKLRIAGGKIPEDEPLIKEAHQRLEKQNISGDVEFLPNLTREEKLDFLRDISILSVPAEHREAFGVYIIEAMASGVPVVQPRHGAFIELMEATGGGVLCEPDDAQALADAMESLLLYPKRARELGTRGRKAVFKNFSAERMARGMMKVLESVAK